MTTWVKQKIKNIGRVVTGKTPPTIKTELLGDEFPFITPTDILDSSIYVNSPERYLSMKGAAHLKSLRLPKDTICYTCIASIGKIAITIKDSFTNQQINSILVDSTKHDFRYLFYLLKYKTPQIRLMAGGVASPIINKTVFENIELMMPDLPIQKQIAGLLAAYDTLIDNNEKRTKVLEEMAQRLYNEWFVKFKFPGYEKVKMVDSGTEYGMIPEGWVVNKLRDVAGYVRGCSYSSDEIDDFIGEYYIVNLKSFNRGGGFRFDGAKYYTGDVNENQLLSEDDIVVAVTDMTNDRAVIARPARIPEIKYKTTLSADVVKIISDILPNSFIYQLLSSYRFTETTKHKANGANVLHLKPDSILEYKALIPTKDLMTKFDVLCSKMAHEINKLINQTEISVKTRDILIPRLVTGKLEIK